MNYSKPRFCAMLIHSAPDCQTCLLNKIRAVLTLPICHIKNYELEFLRAYILSQNTVQYQQDICQFLYTAQHIIGQNLKGECYLLSVMVL